VAKRLLFKDMEMSDITSPNFATKKGLESPQLSREIALSIAMLVSTLTMLNYTIIKTEHFKATKELTRKKSTIQLSSSERSATSLLHALSTVPLTLQMPVILNAKS